MDPGEERRTSAVELLWDLVFVFAVTQVSTLLARGLSWSGFGRSMLVLALIWWAWSAFVWAANAEDPDSPALRTALLTAMILIFVTGLSIPGAFTGRATLFACTYAGVRLIHLALYADASRKGQASWAAIIGGFGLTVLAGMALLIVGSFLDGAARIVLWTAAALIDYAGPAWLTRERLRGLQEVAVAHFAERYGLFVIICLGESIVAIGVGANGRPLDAELVAAAACGLLITVGLWWTYFDRLSTVAAECLRTHRDPVLVAADGYSYLHLVLVAGIIVFAVGMRFAIHGGDHELGAGARLALCGGIALYLVGQAAFRLRLTASVSYRTLVAAAAALAVFALGSALPGWAVAACIAVVVGVLCAGDDGLGEVSESAAAATRADAISRQPAG